jgi:peptide-methionine (R)-S-oxide reductase
MCFYGGLFTALGTYAVAMSLAAGQADAQDPLENAPLAPESAARGKVSEVGSAEPAKSSKPDAKSKASTKPEFITKSPAEWRKILTKSQFAVTRGKMTEPPFTGKYASGHFHGTFVCACCDAAHVQSELFASKTKFDSGTGWPSFYQAYGTKSLQSAWDYSETEPRIEVMCRRCGAHLGHVFDDGPPPTGLRFCINSESIKLVSPEAEASSKGSTAKKSATASKTKSKAKTSAKSSSKGVPADESTEPHEAPSAPAGEKTATDSPPRGLGS